MSKELELYQVFIDGLVERPEEKEASRQGRGGRSVLDPLFYRRNFWTGTPAWTSFYSHDWPGMEPLSRGAEQVEKNKKKF